MEVGGRTPDLSGSFADFDGDGIGDIGGGVGWLDDLQAVGVDVSWLLPVDLSPWDDAG